MTHTDVSTTEAAPSPDDRNLRRLPARVAVLIALSALGALLIAAILWNLGTWWLGLPASSSHTLMVKAFSVPLACAAGVHTSDSAVPSSVGGPTR